MHHNRYPIEASDNLLKFEFFSEGSKGKIKKQIVFKALKGNPYIYNLGFGDVDSEGEIDDIVVTDNNDSQKVLATVALAVYRFLEVHFNCFVYATGSTAARTRLYRIGINNNLNFIINDFEVFGLINNEWEVFTKDRNYTAFLIKRKDSIFDKE